MKRKRRGPNFRQTDIKPKRQRNRNDSTMNLERDETKRIANDNELTTTFLKDDTKFERGNDIVTNLKRYCRKTTTSLKRDDTKRDQIVRQL